jgi:hypothetical protein
MTTDRQFIANRQNAQHSTGPRTQAGQATASRNNTRHGLNTTLVQSGPRRLRPPHQRLHELRRERILPQPTGFDNVIRYETHLTRQLSQTLIQLRQLQQHREASRLRVPYNDYHVDIDSNPIPAALPPSQPPESDLHSTSEYTP